MSDIFHDVLSSPFHSRMVHGVEVNNFSLFMTQKDEEQKSFLYRQRYLGTNKKRKESMVTESVRKSTLNRYSMNPILILLYA